MHRFQRNERPSRKAYAAAHAIALRQEDPVGTGAVGARWGFRLHRAGETEKAEEVLRQALAASLEAGRQDTEAQARNALAGLLIDRGDLPAALEQLSICADLLDTMGREVASLQLRFNESILVGVLGDGGRARALLEGILEPSAELNPILYEKTLLNLGSIEASLGNAAAAEGWFEQVGREDAEIASRADLRHGWLKLREGDAAGAAILFDRSLERATEEQHLDTLFARVGRGRVALAQGRFDDARSILATVIAAAEATDAEEIGWNAWWALGNVSLAEGHPGNAVAELRRAVEILERQGSDLDPAGEALRLLRKKSDPYVDLAAALILDGAPPADIHAVVESARARALRASLGEAQRSLSEIRTALTGGELLLDYLIGEERGVLLALRADGVEMKLLPGWKELRAPLRSYRRALIRPLISAEARLDPDADLLRSLADGDRVGEAFLGPVTDKVAVATRIYVAPDRELALLPPATWRYDGRFLGERVETAMMAMAVPPAKALAKAPVLLAGDPLPDTSGEFPELPRAAEELDRLASLWGDRADTVRGAELSLDGLDAEHLSSFGTLHFATHAIAATQNPEKCAVVLSRGEKLDLQQVRRLELPGSLVVLSACRTAEGEVLPGEGLVGLSWAFLVAGADGLVASLWSVEDAAAAELMVAFHERMRAGDDAVAALHAARAQVRKGRSHPAYWGPFTVFVGGRSAE